MAAGRTQKSLARRRERGGDEDDDDGQLLVGDSQSEGSAVTAADDLEQSGSDENISETARNVAKKSQSGQTHSGKRNGKNRKQGAKGSNEDRQNGLDSTQPPAFKVNADTEAMMHGLSLADKTQDVVDYDTTVSEPQSRSKTSYANGEQAGKQRREHEEYKKKRDSDPAFIPNRGNFFMHDTRGQSNGGPTPFRGNAAGRGRGRAGISDANNGSHGGALRAERASEQVWKHDLHAAINEEPATGAVSFSTEATNGARTQRQPGKTSSGPVSFSSTQLLGRIQLRVLLPGMAKPITYSEVPATKYVRLPDHRPPLRRDKPIRIFLPSIGPRYIFPSTERSFIFIPRQMRPNQRGFANIQQRNIGGYGYSSRRTSMYGGSMYSASVAASRRSSITRDRENMFSPASYASGFQPPHHRPVVRLPHNGQYYTSSTPPMLPYSGQHTPAGQIHTYPLPQQPAFQGTPTTTVQHPRPQKAISVSGIESPAILAQQQQPPTDQQAFHGQLPMHIANHSAHPSQGSIAFEYSQQQFAYPTGPAAGSPLSRIPEHALHANNFQPPQMYYPAYNAAQQPFYYPPMQMQMPMYTVPAAQQDGPSTSGASTQSSQPLTGPGQGVPGAHDFASQSSQVGAGMVAHESNGMVFYMPATEAAAQSNAAEQYQPAEGFVPTYAAAGLPVAAPDQNMYYYMGMPGVSNNMAYYPSGQQN